MNDLPDLAHRMSLAARALDATDGVTAAAQAIVRTAVDLVPGGVGAELTLHRPRRVGGSTGPPGVQDSYRHFLDDEPPQESDGPGGPGDGTGCVGPDARCRQNHRVHVGDHDLGVLSVWSRHPAAEHEPGGLGGQALATHAALALRHAAEREQFATALASRDVIGQAKGILMHRFRLTGDQAFRLLRGRSMDSNRGLREIADSVVGTGALPALDVPVQVGPSGPGSGRPDRPAPVRPTTAGSPSGAASPPTSPPASHGGTGRSAPWRSPTVPRPTGAQVTDTVEVRP